jgi:hypothetical protein
LIADSLRSEYENYHNFSKFEPNQWINIRAI